MVREHVVELAADDLPVGLQVVHPREVGRVVERLLRQDRRARDEPVDRTKDALTDRVGERDDAVPEPHGGEA